jgi:hypothetical protein
MFYPSDIPAAQNVLFTYVMSYGQDLPAGELTDRLISAISEVSPVDRFVKFGELVFANSANLPNEALVTGAKIIGFAAGATGVGPFHGLQEDDRGMKMAKALRRNSGEEGEWPQESEDPTPKPEYTINENPEPEA